MTDSSSGPLDPSDELLVERWFCAPESLSEAERQRLRAPRLRERIADLEGVGKRIQRMGDAERQAILGEAAEEPGVGRVEFDRDGVPYYDPRSTRAEAAPLVEPTRSRSLRLVGWTVAVAVVLVALVGLWWWPARDGGGPSSEDTPILLGTDLGLRARWHDGALVTAWEHTAIGDVVTVTCAPVGRDSPAGDPGEFPRATCYRGERTWTFSAEQLRGLPSRFDVVLAVADPVEAGPPQVQRLTLSRPR